MTLHPRPPLLVSLLVPVLGGALGATLACDPGSARVTVIRAQTPRPVLHAAAVARPRLTIEAVTATEAEDGSGHVVTVLPNPRALDLHASSWRARALDPVLHVGDLHFHGYSFPSREVMRFVVDDVGRLPVGAEVWLQWGDDESSRVVLTHSLEVPK
ncbi:MAG: hypothetical protein AB1Z98_07470 [Nannocystaceae bacterium]